ncbi:uncharacterized protein LOC135473341 [Liolophura sinensis]|uniref:uncharacterized protein LOC135473341 n=1 Tax=Liolophura sinensis TaxID=3198878 RepID=UPI0031584B55
MVCGIWYIVMLSVPLSVTATFTFQGTKTAEIPYRASKNRSHALFTIANMTQPCGLRTADENIYDTLYYIEKNAKLIEFELSVANYTPPTADVDSLGNYRPLYWVRAPSKHGQTLLMLSFNYDILSLTMLTIGVAPLNVSLLDSPPGCFSELQDSERNDLIRQFLLKGLTTERDRLYTFQEQYVCNQIIQNISGYAHFMYHCCRSGADGKVICLERLRDVWITVLYICITLVKLMVLLYSPVLVPQSMYKVKYMAEEYVVKLTKKPPVKVFISEKEDAPVKYKKRLTPSDIFPWRQFRELVETLPRDEIVDLRAPELHLRVQTKRLLPENEAPTGLMHLLYENLIRCKLRHIEPFTECCGESIFGPAKNNLDERFTWHHCLVKFIRILLMLAIIPIPYFARLAVYYIYEQAEILRRRQAINVSNVTEPYSFFRGSLLQYLQPSHPIFITMYVLYFLAGFIIIFANKSIRLRFRDVIQGSLRDMSNVSHLETFSKCLRLIIWPFKRLGILGLVLAPFYWAFMVPLSVIGFVFYCVPTIYMSFRLVSYSRNYVVKAPEDVDKIEKLSLRERLAEVKNKFLRRFQMKPEVPRGSVSESISYLALPMYYSRCQFLREVVLQLLVGLSCLALLYAMTLLLMECVTLFVEVVCFTLMGIIVNAGSTLKYVSLVFLVVLYSHDCYNNVYKNYLEFNKNIVEDMMKRVDDLQKVACLPSSVQENVGFKVKPVDENQEIDTELNYDKKKLRWQVGHLLLFLDSNDTPRIPLKLFQELCNVRVAGCPGPVYLSHLRATGKFMNIILFLLFVMIVVMAFGEVYRISSTNQMMATLAGGFLPWLFKTVWISKAQSLSLNTISFKGQVDETINSFKQNWALHDLILEPDVPEESTHGSDSEDDSVASSNESKKSKKSEKHNDDDTKDKNPEKVSEKDKSGSMNSNHLSPNDAKQPNGELKKASSMTQSMCLLNMTPETDLFVDLSNVEGEMLWVHGSHESLPSIESATMMPDGYMNEDYVNEVYPV